MDDLNQASASLKNVEMTEVTIYYLEMLGSNQRSVPVPRDGLTVDHFAMPSVSEYRSLYHAVGKDYRWLSRRKLSDAALSEILGHPLNEVYVLKVGSVPGGFAEMDRRQPGEIELVQFGLIPDFIGQGLGKWFLQWTIDKAFRYQPKRLWLHTCTFDHPAAIPNYRQAGFTQFRQDTIHREY